MGSHRYPPSFAKKRNKDRSDPSKGVGQDSKTALLEASLQKIYSAIKLPRLPPSEYYTVFSLIAPIANKRGSLRDAAASIVTRASSIGLKLALADVRFILRGIDTVDPQLTWVRSTEAVAYAYRIYILTLCKEVNLQVNDEDHGLIQAWFSYVPSIELPLPAKVQEKPSEQAKSATEIHSKKILSDIIDEIFDHYKDKTNLQRGDSLDYIDGIFGDEYKKLLENDYLDYSDIEIASKIKIGLNELSSQSLSSLYNAMLAIQEAEKAAALPTEAPFLYDDREDKRETAPEFIKRVYGPYLNGMFTRAYLKKLDPKAYKALDNWLQNPRNEFPADLNLPTVSQKNDLSLEEFTASKVRDEHALKFNRLRAAATYRKK
ncbi:hypothetical protein H7X87_01470 [Acetobacteraceae bacterium]|nr:hypothetical protein [Candidatus Parcubacteria bacterium]